jgi:Concanavalin A-like lectin/glucanases superfamily
MKSKISSFLFAVGITGSLVFGFSSCSDEEEKLPAIGGFNNSDEVAASNLVAHWAFEGDGKEKKSSSAPTTSVGATFIAGAKGKAVDFKSGYLAYGEIAALNSLPNMTVSTWAKFDNNGTHPTCFFTMTRPNEWAGNINLMSETGWKKAGNDTLVVKGLVVTKVANNPSFQDSRNEPSKGGVQVPKGVNMWHQLVMTWDGATSNYKIYVDGVKVNNPEWEQRGTTGPLSFFTPTKPVIGAWGTNLPGGTAEAWQVPMTGSVDELRVFNKALTDAEISALYQLEKAGR